MIYQCCDEKRKAAVLGNPTLNGIDYLEVLGFDAEPLGLAPQTILMVRCLKAAPTGLTPDNIIIAGGESITNITATFVTPATTPPATHDRRAGRTISRRCPAPPTSCSSASAQPATFRHTRCGWSTSATQARKTRSKSPKCSPASTRNWPKSSSPSKSSVRPFSTASRSRRTARPICPRRRRSITWRRITARSARIILDRLSQLLPAWGASSEADLGIALAELIAYVGDPLSYKQDAVATEAYLQTARSRISLRRHALLVDYHVHDGCNARAWMQLQVNVPVDLDGTALASTPPRRAMPSTLAGNERAALDAGVIIFEAMQDAQLFPEHNQMSFYTWGEADCCLPKGATEATLLGTFAKLQAGDVLIFQEMVGPQTGNPADADVRHRCAVRLTRSRRRTRRATRWSIRSSRRARASRSLQPRSSRRRSPRFSGRRPTRFRSPSASPASSSIRSRRNRRLPTSAKSSAMSCWPTTAVRLTEHRSGHRSAPQHLLARRVRPPTVAIRRRRSHYRCAIGRSFPTAPSRRRCRSSSPAAR